MSISKALEFLDSAKSFKVEKHGYGYYTVEFKDDGDEYPLSANYTDGEGWSYYVGGVYNNGSDYAPVDIGRLAALKAFCESLGGDAR